MWARRLLDAEAFPIDIEGRDKEPARCRWCKKQQYGFVRLFLVTHLMRAEYVECTRCRQRLGKEVVE